MTLVAQAIWQASIYQLSEAGRRQHDEKAAWMRSAATKTASAIFAIVAALSIGGAATAASKIDEFREAASSGANSCKIIPYEETRDECRKAQEEVKNADLVKSSCDDLDRGQADFKSEVARRIQANQTKIATRREVRKIFANVYDRLGNESAEELRPYVETIRKKIDDGSSGHAEQIKGLESSVYKCEQMAR